MLLGFTKNMRYSKFQTEQIFIMLF